MQKPGAQGLEPATKKERRAVVRPIHQAGEHQAEQVVNMWAGRTPQQAYEVLSQPDIAVTNEKDKFAQLPKLVLLNEKIRAVVCARPEVREMGRLWAMHVNSNSIDI